MLHPRSARERLNFLFFFPKGVAFGRLLYSSRAALLFAGVSSRGWRRSRNAGESVAPGSLSPGSEDELDLSLHGRSSPSDDILIPTLGKWPSWVGGFYLHKNK